MFVILTSSHREELTWFLMFPPEFAKYCLKPVQAFLLANNQRIHMKTNGTILKLRHPRALVSNLDQRENGSD